MKVKLAILFFFFYWHINAQDTTSTWYSPPMHRTPTHRPPPKEPFIDKSKIFVGGNFGLQFGTITYLDLSPLVGYRISDHFSAGVGVTYQYLKDNFYNVETNVFGGRVFGRYFIRQNIFAHAEYNVLNLQAFDLYPAQRINVGSLLVGGGYIQRFAKNSGMTVMLLYNLTPSVYSPYQNPIIQVGMILGL